MLIEGPSGGGKSTLASILAGGRTPQAGSLLMHGLDRHTLGERNWKRSAALVPQFHENHVLTGSFAFNLMMGRRWPPQAEDFTEMETLCRDLGLEDLLKRMPSGLQQSVGDSGWQLSHGERSRLYLGRALLQSPNVIVLDETFAALDPKSLRCAAGSVSRRVQTVVVIAHR